MRTIVAGLIAILVSSCGGGGGGGDSAATSSSSNLRPTASAGADFSVEERSTGTLDGSASQDSDGSISAYSWRQISGPSVTLNNSGQASASFASPEVSPDGAELEFELTVTDNQGATATDAVTVTIVNVNLPPVAVAGDDRDEPERSEVPLDATSSSDPDVGISEFLWRQLSGPPATINQADAAATSITTPEVGPDGAALEFEVTVTDTGDATATDSVVINVFNVNLPPLANAGSDQSVYEGHTAVLDGTSSADQDGEITSYAWRLVSGATIDIPDLNQAQVTFTAPATNQAFENVYELTVTDELGDSSTDQVSVLILPIIPPVADAGPDQVVESESSVQLTGLGSTDADGRIVEYQWNQITGPAVSLDDPALPEANFVAPLVAEFTLLQFELTVIDDANATSADMVDITVTPPQHDVSGTISVSDGTLVDSDVNDPAAPYESNDTANTAQFLPVPVTVGGYSNRPFQGAAGRSYSSGDIWDVYRVVLTAGQPAELHLGDSLAGDLDLYLWDVSGISIVDASLSTTAMETIVAPSDGEFLIEVYAFSGASNYVLSVKEGAAATAVAPLSLHHDFVPHQAIVKHRVGLESTTKTALGMKRQSGTMPRPTLYTVNPDIGAMARFSGHEPDELEKRAAAFKQPELRSKWETLLAIKALRSEKNVEYAEPNYIRRINFTPNDEFYERQWHYRYINVPDAWDITTGDPSVVVAVVDTGVLLGHPDLQGNVANGYDFIADVSNANDGDGIDPDPDDPGDDCVDGEDSSFHGTHVAGTIGANTNNQTGVAGIAGGATIMPVRVLGCVGGYSYDIAQGVLYAAGLENDAGVIVDDPADIINLSLGGTGYSQFSQDVYSAVRDSGVIVVAAAGNDASNLPHYPSGYDGVISVSATGADGNRAGYSNFGAEIDVAAPGGASTPDVDNDGFPDHVYSTDGEEVVDGPIDFTYEYKTGTSMATPHVAGVLALMKSVNPAITPADIDALLIRQDIVVDIGALGWDWLYGWGLIDAKMSVDAAIAATGNPPADNPAMIVRPRNLHFGAFTPDTSLEVSNGAGGELVVGVFSIPPEAQWLSLAGQNVDVNGVGTYTFSADRTGLAEGVYSTNLSVASNANTVQLQATMIVPPELEFTASAGQLYVILIDPATGDSINGAVVVRALDQWQFTVTGVFEGDYYIQAGSDSDNDFFICDGGESCGAYFGLDNQVMVTVDSDIADIDFPVNYDWFLPVEPASNSTNPGPEATKRLPLSAEGEVRD